MAGGRLQWVLPVSTPSVHTGRVGRLGGQRFFCGRFPNVGDTRITVFDDAVNICGRASTNDRFLGR